MLIGDIVRARADPPTDILYEVCSIDGDYYNLKRLSDGNLYNGIPFSSIEEVLILSEEEAIMKMYKVGDIVKLTTIRGFTSYGFRILNTYDDSCDIEDLEYGDVQNVSYSRLKK